MKRSPEIEAVVRRFLAARAEGDLDEIRDLFSESDDLRVIGTDAHEWHHGPEVTGMMSAHWEAFSKWDDVVKRLEAFENGGTGWAALEGKRTLADGEEYLYRLTVVLQLEAGVWRIAQLHYSVPVPNEEASSFELTRTLSELLAAIEIDSDSSAVGDRVSGTSTIVFTDIVGSTATSHAMGEIAWAQLISDHLRLLREIVESAGGSVVKTLGDGGMYVFSSGSSALQAATHIQEAVSESDVDVRIGVHTGDVVKDHHDYIGLTVAKAARVATAADGGQILVSTATAEMVNPSEFQFGTPLTVELKGLEGTHLLQPLKWS